MAVGAAAVLALALAAPSCAGAFAGKGPDVKARSGIVIVRSTGKVLWSKSADLRLAPASCAKIMTALVVLQHEPDLGRLLRAPNSVTAYQKVAIGLRPGDRITVRQALRGMLIKSANDAAVTLAGGVAGGEGRFVKLMNQRARALGLVNTHFLNCRGTPQPGLYSSARDLAKLGRVAMLDPDFRAIVKTKTAVVRWPPAHAVTVTSHNLLLDYPWADGIKTGSTSRSKMVLVGSGKLGAEALIVVTMREPTREQEVRDAVALFKWGSAQNLQGRAVRIGASALAGTPASPTP